MFNVFLNKKRWKKILKKTLQTRLYKNLKKRLQTFITTMT